MSVKFQLLGDSLDAYFASAFKGHGVLGGTDANLPIVDTAIPGVWTGKMIDMSQRKALSFLAADNWCVGSDEFTIHLRMVPKWTGDAAVFESFVAVFNSSYIQNGVLFGLDGPPAYAAIQNANGGNVFGGDISGPTIPFVTDEARDIYLVQSKTQVKLYTNAHGVVAALLSATNVGATPAARLKFLATQLAWGAFDGRFSNWYLAEANILDAAIDPIALGVRTGPMAVPGNIERYAQTNVGTTNVIPGATYVYQGDLLTGNAPYPDVADIREGVLGGTLVVASPADTRFGVATDNTTGLAHIPARADTRFGVAVDQSTGLAVIPSLANTKVGVAGDGGTGTYDGSDRWTSPDADELLLGVALKSNSLTPNLTGTLVSPSLANTKVGVAGNGGTGTYDGSDRWTSPTASQLAAGVSLKSNSLTPNLTGTLLAVTNLISRLTVGSSDGSAITVTQGDVLGIDMIAKAADETPFDLTGASLETRINGLTGVVTIANSEHTVAPNQTTNKGKVTISLLAGVSDQFKPGDGHDVVTIATWNDGRSLAFHGFGVLNVKTAFPRRLL